MTALMIDIETAGNRPTSAIASIGACRFDPHGASIGDIFHVHVSLANGQRHGLTLDADTFLWWLGRKSNARRDLIAGQADAAPLVTALEALADFISGSGPEPEIWCNGNSFDLPILANACHAVGLPLPWKFWQERDLRTLIALNKGIRIERAGIHHNALDDAIYQALLVQHIHAKTREITP